jgi:Putative threonine/serine exporter
MIAPLVTFLPGAMLTMAVAELSAAQLVTGASRLVAGIVQLVLLGFGIVAGAQLAEVSSSTVTLINTPENLLGWWAPWLGVLVFGVGVYRRAKQITHLG